ncbi:MAG: hypothetical protein MMC23_001749 [Stictis urceolatum]|nr:hypothetical protein [Stictis urceolata]
MRSVFEGPITQEMKQWYIKLRLESIEGQDPDTFDICTRDTETGEIVSVATFKVEAEKTTDNYKQIKTPETQYPANMDGDRLNQYMRTEQEKSIETMGGRAHIYLARLHTSPAHQRRGAASMLLKQMLSKADSLNLPAYLTSTPAGFPLYSKYGFKTISTFTYGLPDVPVAAQTTTCMIRPAPNPSAPPTQSVPASAPRPVLIETLPIVHSTMLIMSSLMDQAFGPAELSQLCFGTSNRTSTLEQRATLELQNAETCPENFLYHAAMDPETRKPLGLSKWYFASDPHAEHAPNGNTREQPGINVSLFDAMFGKLRRYRESLFRGKSDGKGESYVYMCLLVVAPEAQRRGIGGKLLDEGLKVVDRRDEECFIDASPEGKGLYEKHGWREVTRVQVDLKEWGGTETAETVGLVRSKGGKGEFVA